MVTSVMLRLRQGILHEFETTCSRAEIPHGTDHRNDESGIILHWFILKIKLPFQVQIGSDWDIFGAPRIDIGTLKRRSTSTKY